MSYESAGSSLHAAETRKARAASRPPLAPLARPDSGTSWNGSCPKIVTGSAVSNSAGSVTGSSRGSSLRARAGSYRPGWRARASHKHPAPPPVPAFFFFNHSCARVGEKRTGRETGQRDGTDSLLWKEPPGTQIHQSVMTIPNPAHPPPRRSQSEVPRQKADWVGGEKQFSQYQKEERRTSANHFWTYRVFLRCCSLPWALIGFRVRAFAADC